VTLFVECTMCVHNNKLLLACRVLNLY